MNHMKKITLATLVIFCFFILGYIAYFHSILPLIRAMYEGHSLPFLNHLILKERPLSFYETQALRIFVEFNVFFLALVVFVVARRQPKKSAKLFSCRTMLIVASSFIMIAISCNILSLFLMRLFKYYGMAYWPLSIFFPRWATLPQVALALFILGAFPFIFGHIAKKEFPLPLVIETGLLLLLVLTALQGITGFSSPVIEAARDDPPIGLGYYHDSVKITSVLDFLQTYESKQPTLACHGVTHPPGPNLMIYLLYRLVKTPGLIGASLGILSLSLSLFFFYRILITCYPKPFSGYGTLILALIPSTQIYYLASIDALIASFFLAAVYFFMREKRLTGVLGSFICLLLGSFFTFSFLFLLPVLLFIDICKRKNALRFIVVIVGVLIAYIAGEKILGFNYAHSFMISYRKHNIQGLPLFYFPGRYVLTVLESLCEVLLFLGPFLVVMLWRAMKISGKEFLNTKKIFTRPLTLTHLGLTGLAVFAAMCVLGTFAHGEAARIGLFAVPYALFSGLSGLARETDEKSNFRFAYALLCQSVFMQLMGDYVF